MVKRARRALEAFFGACLIYTVMAACNGGGNANSTSGGHGHGGTGHGGAGMGGAMAGPGGSDGSGIMDALTDPVPDAMADTNSGSRLKGAFVESVDGAREYLHVVEFEWGTGGTVSKQVWFDTMLDTNCVFRMAADGKLRCLPGPMLSSNPPIADYLVVWADPTCTTTSWMTMPRPPVNCANYDPPDYGIEFVHPPTQCSDGHTPGQLNVFKTGGLLSPQPSAQTVYLLDSSTGLCQSIGDTSNRVVYAATPVAPGQFAEVKSAIKHDP